MEPVFVVFTDLSNAAEAALAYTAQLAQQAHGRVVLVHVYQDPLLVSEVEMVGAPSPAENQRQVKAHLQQQMQQLPVPAEVELSVNTLAETVSEVTRRYRPVLLVLGREQPAGAGIFNRLEPNQAATLLEQSHYPVLLVPQNWQESPPPQRVIVAADEQHFALKATTDALQDWLKSLSLNTTVVHVTGHDGPSRADVGLQAAQDTGLFGHLTDNSLYEVRGEAPTDGILHAAAELQAQLLIVFARPHTWLGELFHRSVTAQLLRRTTLPVLVIPTA